MHLGTLLSKSKDEEHNTCVSPFLDLALIACPLYYFNTVKNIFMKHCTDINCHQTMCREEES